MGLGRLFVYSQTSIDGADYPRDLYISYGRLAILDLRAFLMIIDKIGTIGSAATSLSGKQMFAELSFHLLTF